MKKLIVFASLLAAVAVQASTVDWGISKQTTLAGYNVAIVDSSVITALIGGASPYADEASMNADIAAGKAYSAAGLASALTSVGTVNGKGTLATKSVENAGENLTAILWTGTPADGGKFLYGTFSTSGFTYDKPATPPGTLYITPSGLSEGTFTAATYTQSGGQDPIPEPTTVALLALGLAAVGLKRKVA